MKLDALLENLNLDNLNIKDLALLLEILINKQDDIEVLE